MSSLSESESGLSSPSPWDSAVTCSPPCSLVFFFLHFGLLRFFFSEPFFESCCCCTSDVVCWINGKDMRGGTCGAGLFRRVCRKEDKEVPKLFLSSSKPLCFLGIRMLQSTMFVLDGWGTNLYCLRILKLWSSRTLCDKPQLQANGFPCHDTIGWEQMCRWGHPFEKHLLSRYFRHTWGKLLAAKFLIVPLGCLTKPNFSTLFMLPSSWKSWERWQSPVHLPSKYPLQICQNGQEDLEQDPFEA